MPQDVKPQDPPMSPPVLPEARTLVGIALSNDDVPTAHEIPTSWLETTVEKAMDFGTLVDEGKF